MNGRNQHDPLAGDASSVTSDSAPEPVSVPDIAGSGEFAIGFEPATAPAGDDSPLSRALAAVQEAQESFLAVDDVTKQIVQSCIDECRGPASDCAACLNGRIEEYKSKAVQALINMTSRVQDSAIRAVAEARNQLFSLPDGTAARGVTRTIHGDPGTIKTGGSSDSTPIGGGSTGDNNCGPCEFPVNILRPDLGCQPNPLCDETITHGGGGGSGTITTGGGGGGGGTTTTTTTTTPAPCIVKPNPWPAGCPITKCMSDCETAGGVWSDIGPDGQFRCLFSDGAVVNCTYDGSISGGCLKDYSDCKAFVNRAYPLGWRLVQPDSGDLNIWAARNIHTGETVYCNNSATACGQYSMKSGPCPRPEHAPIDSAFLVRDDSIGYWVDTTGHVWEPACDCSGCMPPEMQYENFGIQTLFITFPDGKSGWLDITHTGLVLLCQEPIEPITTPTVDNVSDWIAEQDEPDDWSIEWNEESGEYVATNSVTSEVQQLGGQTPAEPITEDEPSGNPADDADDVTFTLEDADELFAGRV